MIDGKHISAFVPINIQGPFHNRKETLSQNIMATCGFDLSFLYVLPGYEGSAGEIRLLQNVLQREVSLVILQGKLE